MRPSNLLTELSIKQSKPKEKQYKITDGEGMYLRIHPLSHFGSEFLKIRSGHS